MIMLSENKQSNTKMLIEETNAFFVADGPLKKAETYGGRPYEYRIQQAQMANEVAYALTNKLNLCVEAPTGVGKSFAYLVPAIQFAITNTSPVLITTETIHLQEQLIEKDLPLLQDVMGLKFKAVLAKGRSNYLCRRRLHIATMGNPEEYFPATTEPNTILKLEQWADSDEGGSRATLNFQIDPKVWETTCCEVGNCRGPKCSFYRSCFYWKARKQWDKADIIVANHALFFTDLGLRNDDDQETALLPNYSAVVFDEAHTLEDSAAEHLGLHISGNGIHYFLNRLYDAKQGRGMLVRKGLEAMELRTTISELQQTAKNFFNLLQNQITNDKESIARVKEPHIVPDLLSNSLYKLKSKLREYMDLIDDDDLKSELESQCKKCDFYSSGIYEFLNMELKEHVYWIESQGSTKYQNTVLNAAPTNIAQLLQQLLFGTDTPIILTSATLTVNNRFDYYRNRVGFSNGREVMLNSPFNFAKQVTLHIPRDMSDPDDENYVADLVKQIKKYITITHGKAFVLFTSYHMLKLVANSLDEFFLDKGITLLVQGNGLGRTAMLQQFKQDTNSVIFGTTSFWTGVDVPGEALSNVIITKLPFSVPSHPLIQARVEAIEKLGKNSFMNYSLPEAVLKFRQGVGRLIRSKKDKGIVVLLDKRVITKRYGSYFINSIPPCPRY